MVAKRFLILIFMLFVLAGCTTKGFVKADKIQYTIQVGAYSNFENVEKNMNILSAKGLDPYYFKDENNIYKIRFGNFYTFAAAKYTAEKLKEEKVIDDYLIVTPDNFNAKRPVAEDSDDMRQQIVDTALNYLGTPYVRGGSGESGFDCSGFVQMVYRMNGIELPRTSLEQYNRGDHSELKKGDLVFFKINGRSVSHVGIYIGNGKFIHAPRVNGKVRIEELSLPYYQKRYVGAKTYLKSTNVASTR